MFILPPRHEKNEVISIRIERCDVLIIGSGGAGLREAIELHDQHVDVLVVGKCKKRDAHTILATGGINAALGTMDPHDSWKLHAADTIRDGGFINDIPAVLLLCQHAKRAIDELVSYGVPFHRESNGKITQRFFGAATYRRACFVGDCTGKAILDALVDQVTKRKIRFHEETYVFSLLHFNGVVNGALALNVRDGAFIVYHAKVVVLATGGHSRVFVRSSSRFWENTGDGIGLASVLGATFMDMELFQFHPTGMIYPPKAEGMLVTESVRGEGGILLNTNGERFMHRYDPQRLELSARDVVARAIYHEIAAGRGTKHGGVFLDIHHKPKAYILKRLPKMYAQFKRYVHLDISKEKMEVAPTAHYSMGGILVDQRTGETTIPRLFAVGEVTAGVHGANRLGGNSLLELIVFGRLHGEHLARALKTFSLIPLDGFVLTERLHALELFLEQKKGKDPLAVKKEIQEIMWKCAGVIRNKKDLEHGLRKIRQLQNVVLSPGKTLQMNKKLIAALDVLQMLPTCEMILLSALHRTESRGAHYRSDYPKTLERWRKNILCTPTARGVVLKFHRVSLVPPEIKKYLKWKPQIHLLE